MGGEVSVGWVGVDGLLVPQWCNTRVRSVKGSCASRAASGATPAHRLGCHAPSRAGKWKGSVMASAVSSVESLCNRSLKSRLLKPPQVRKVYGEWRKIQAPGIAGEVDRFNRWLVSKHHLTAYQAQQVALGHTDHFFLTNQYKLLDLV